MPEFPHVRIPGFDLTDWMLHLPSPWEDPETGETLPGGEPCYIARFVRMNAFPNAPDGKTGATDSMVITLSDIERNPDHIVELIQNQAATCEMSLRDLFASKGVEFPHD